MSVTEWDRVPLTPLIVTVKVVGVSGFISASTVQLAVLVPPGMTRIVRGRQYTVSTSPPALLEVIK